MFKDEGKELSGNFDLTGLQNWARMGIPIGKSR
jgi:hypothetical protein